MVSVLMTAYNREKYIGIAIESVLKSTFRNFELIIVDDGSTDDTVNIARRYAEQDARIRLFINEVNLGDYPNRNKAASYARGKYLKYVDSDDYIYPYGLELMLYYMEQPEMADAAMGIIGLTQDNGAPYPLKLPPREAIRRHYVDLKFTLGVASLSVIIRREVFEREGGFKPMRMTGDYECWSRLALKYTIVLLPIIGCWYRRHPGQEVSDAQKFIGIYHNISATTLREALNKGFISREELRYAERRLNRKFLLMMFNITRRTLRLREIKHLLKTADDSLAGVIRKAL